MSECHPGYYPADAYNACEVCSTPHAASFSRGCNVTTCDSGYMPNADGTACSACGIPHAETYEAGHGTCVVSTCIVGYSPVASGLSCVGNMCAGPITAGSQVGHNYAPCTGHVTGESCTPVCLPGHTTSLTGDTQSFFLSCNADGAFAVPTIDLVCSPCSIDHAIQYASACTVQACAPGFEPNDSGTSCDSCGVAHALAYSTGCLPSECSAGYRPVEAFACEACNITRAIAYSSGCTTSQCEPGFSPAGETCAACTVQHAEEYAETCTVSKCSPGFQPNQAQSECQACAIPHAVEFESTGPHCSVAACTSGYSPSSNSMVCQAMAYWAHDSCGGTVSTTAVSVDDTRRVSCCFDDVSAVTGHRDLPGLIGCSGLKTYPGAVDFCAAAGYRLCTPEELSATCGTGEALGECGYDIYEVWTSKAAQCAQHTFAVGVIGDGTNACSSTVPLIAGSSCALGCLPGYLPIGQATLSCPGNADGLTQAFTAFACTADDCEVPEINPPEHGQLDAACTPGQTMTGGTSCALTCLYGLKPVGTQPSCVAGVFNPGAIVCIECSAMSEVVSVDFCEDCVGTATADCTAAICAPGYANYTASDAACLAKECSVTEVPNSDKSTSGAIFGVVGDQVTITCNSGYSGGGLAICSGQAGNEEPEFSTSPCTENSCAAYALSGAEPGDTNPCSDSQVLSATTNPTCNFVCLAGYSGGYGELRCASDASNGDPATPNVTCVECTWEYDVKAVALAADFLLTLHTPIATGQTATIRYIPNMGEAQAALTLVAAAGQNLTVVLDPTPNSATASNFAVVVRGPHPLQKRGSSTCISTYALQSNLAACDFDTAPFHVVNSGFAAELQDWESSAACTSALASTCEGAAAALPPCNSWDFDAGTANDIHLNVGSGSGGRGRRRRTQADGWQIMETIKTDNKIALVSFQVCGAHRGRLRVECDLDETVASDMRRYIHTLEAGCSNEEETVVLRFDENNLLSVPQKTGCDRIRILVNTNGWVEGVCPGTGLWLRGLSMQRQSCAGGQYRLDTGACAPCESCNAAAGLFRTGCAGAEAGICSVCPVGKYSTDGLICNNCPASRYVCTGGIKTKIADGLYCPAGESCADGTVAVLPCGSGSGTPERFYCFDGQRHTTGVGNYSSCRDLESGCPATARSSQEVCGPGTFCQLGTSEPCIAGTYQPLHGQTECLGAEPGKFVIGVAATQQNNCTAGHYCPEDGARLACASTSYCPTNTAIQQVCPSGYYCAAPSDKTACEVPSQFCPEGVIRPLQVQSGYYSTLGGADGDKRVAQFECEPGHHCIAGDRFVCDQGSYCQGGSNPVMVSAVATATVVFLLSPVRNVCE